MTCRFDSSENILLKHHHDYVNRPQASQLGNSDVLAEIMPQLFYGSVLHQKPSTKLEGIDSYMMQEVSEVCRKLTSLCQQPDVSINGEITFQVANKQLQVTDQTDADSLVSLANADKWLKGALEWLHPNFVELVHSAELLAFSKLYQKGVNLAVEKYSHFSYENYGLKFIIACTKNRTSIKIDSPVQSYVII